MHTKTLIIDTRKELSTKYKKILEDTSNHVEIIKDIPIALKFIQSHEPDLIIISDSINEDLCNFCERLRILTYNMRPVIVAVSKSAETSDKIKVLESGADDFISEPVNSEEFKIRIKAHIRREYETNLDSKTKLPTIKYCKKALKRMIAGENQWACLLTSIENLYSYKEAYTELASDRLLQTFAAIISSSLDKNDYLGMISDRDFLILTTAEKVEKIASFITYAFETVKNKFYSEQDLERGYMMIRGDEFTEKRCEFIYAITGGITNKTKHFTNETEALNELKQAYNLAKKNGTSSYLIERPQISGINSVMEQPFNNRITVLEQDSALAFLLTTTLGLKGYAAEKGENIEEIKKQNPAVVILDVSKSETMQELALCKEIKNINAKIKIITTSIYHSKEQIMNAGSDIYLPKPYNIDTLAHWAELAIKEYND
ncbi:response regulator [bacterium]|nr:response regulator [bacterium]